MCTIRLLILVVMLATRVIADVVTDMARIHCEALGGRSRIAEVNSLRAIGITRIGEKTLNIVIVAQRPNRVRTEVLADGHRIVTAYDGVNPPWQCDATQGASQKSLIGGAASQEFIADSEFFDPLITLDSRGFTLHSLGKAEWDKTSFQCLLALRAGEEPLELWLDANTYMIDRQMRTRRLPDGLETKVETRFSDFRPVNGILMPYRITVYAGGRCLHETILQNIDANPEIFGSTFQIP